MVADLPPSLSVRLQLSLYLHLIKKVPIFSECEPDCVAFVITLLTPRICIPGKSSRYNSNSDTTLSRIPGKSSRYTTPYNNMCPPPMVYHHDH